MYVMLHVVVIDDRTAFVGSAGTSNDSKCFEVGLVMVYLPGGMWALVLVMVLLPVWMPMLLMLLVCRVS